MRCCRRKCGTDGGVLEENRLETLMSDGGGGKSKGQEGNESEKRERGGKSGLILLIFCLKKLARS